MLTVSKNEFIKKSSDTLDKLWDWLDGLESIKLEDLDSEHTALVIVDMINGFAREGALKSPRVEALIPEVDRLLRQANGKGMKSIAFADAHVGESPEFESYPVHCMAGSSESAMVRELDETGGFILIEKNSTNGFHEEAFQKWLQENSHIKTFIMTGDCTDICIQQLAITLRTWFNRQNIKSRIIVPASAVNTYDLGLHQGDLVHVMALYNMSINGIEIVKAIV